MSPREILEEVAKDTGTHWNETSMLQIMSDYIDNQDENGDFEEYVRDRAQEELEG